MGRVDLGDIFGGTRSSRFNKGKRGEMKGKTGP